MTEHTRHFIDLGRTYIEAHREPGCLCAFAGGSVGRGDADECSDLDLNIYVEPPRESSSENVVFRNKILQVHVHAFPTQDQVEADPWGHRFLMESRVIWDPEGRFARFREGAIGFLQCKAGRRKALEAARDTVHARQAWARESVSKGEMYAAGMAAMAAWIDAALMLGISQEDSVRTSRPLTYLTHAAEIHKAVTAAWPIEMSLDQDAETRLSGLTRYRAHLRRQAGNPGHFALSAHQDVLMARKADREVRAGNWAGLCGEVYAEAFWLVLTAAPGSTDPHMRALPAELRHSLERIGLGSVTEGQVRELCRCADEIVGRAHMCSA